MAALTMSAREQVLFGLNQPAAIKQPDVPPPPVVQGQWDGAPLNLLWSEYVKLAPTVAVAELQKVWCDFAECITASRPASRPGNPVC